jgi:hypothetical protein
MARTIGQVKTTWKFANRPKDFELIWDVLPGFPKEALIGAEFLHQERVFERYSAYFVTDTGDNSCPQTFAIMKSKKANNFAPGGDGRVSLSGIRNRFLCSELGTK